MYSSLLCFLLINSALCWRIILTRKIPNQIRKLAMRIIALPQPFRNWKLLLRRLAIPKDCAKLSRMKLKYFRHFRRACTRLCSRYEFHRSFDLVLISSWLFFIISNLHTILTSLHITTMKKKPPRKHRLRNPLHCSKKYLVLIRSR
jgi:hypothetical protein